MHSGYKLLILYFLAFVSLLVLSGAMLFIHKIGLLPQDILAYYAGSEEEFIAAKTFIGILKVNLPHIFVFGLIGMVVLHLLIFTEYKYKTVYLSYLLYISAFFELTSALFIINGLHFFAYVKLISFILFAGSILYISYLLAHSILRK